MYKIIFGVLGVLLLVDICASFYFYKLAVVRTKKKFLENNKDLEGMASAPRVDDPYAWFEEQKYKRVEIESEEGLRLQGYYLEAEKPSDKTAILAHGYSMNGKSMASFARFYHHTLGYNVLMPNNRGHGESEGNYVGFGWRDRRDYVKWIDYTINALSKGSEVVLHGISMGGAAVLMTSGEKLPSNVKAVISDCAYTSVKDQLSYQLKRMYKLPSFPVLQSTSLLAKIRAGYFFGEASAINQVRKTKLPILFIHGEEDSFVPFEMVNKLYEACMGEKELFIVAKAGHGVAYNFDREGYEKRVAEFLNRYIK